MATDWHDKQSDYQRKIDTYERLSRVRVNMEENFRVLNGKYHLLQRELSDCKQGRSPEARRFFHRFWRK